MTSEIVDMKTKRHLILLISLGLSLISGIIFGVLLSIQYMGWEYETSIFYIDVLPKISLIFNPFIVFIFSYMIGRKFDIKLKLVQTLIFILAISYLGYLSGYITAGLTLVPVVYRVLFMESILTYTIPWTLPLPTIPLTLFFVQISALLIAYIRNPLEQTKNEAINNIEQKEKVKEITFEEWENLAP